MPSVFRKFLIVLGAVSAALATPFAAVAQDAPGKLVASVTYGPYARLEFGAAVPSLSAAFWLPPGRSDPRINFNAGGSTAGFGALAVGYDWQNGLRADFSIFGVTSTNVTAPCSSASNGTACAGHANITSATVTTQGMMANLFYAPLEARGSNSVFQPFLVAGLGLANNQVGSWTRRNPTSGRVTRTFAGSSTTNVAWSIGAGVSLQVTKPGRWPVILEAAWRYYDFGSASGSATPLPGNGGSQPRQPFTFVNSNQVLTLGVRIPLKRY